MSQISLPLDWTGRGGAEQFLVSDANALAVRHLDHWGIWPVATSILTGPARSGRTTLANLFTRKTGGRMIDDAEGTDEEAMFHAWNIAQQLRRPLLIVADQPVEQWNIALPDLRSRLLAAPHVAIEQPDEALAVALIEKALTDAGTAYSHDLPAFLLRRVDQNYAALDQVAAILNAVSLSSGRKISVAFAKEALHGTGFFRI